MQNFLKSSFILLALTSGCFQDPSNYVLKDEDLHNLEQADLLFADIQSKNKGDSVDLDKTTARDFLRALTPIKSVREQTLPLDGVDYEFICQSGRNPLGVEVDVDGVDDSLIFRVGNYVYSGGSIKQFLNAVKQANDLEKDETK